jgi:hypothetical protein
MDRTTSRMLTWYHLDCTKNNCDGGNGNAGTNTLERVDSSLCDAIQEIAGNPKPPHGQTVTARLP